MLGKGNHIYLTKIAVSLLLFFLSFIATADELRPVKLQLRWLHQYQFAGYYAALEQGYYRDAGLDVTIVEGAPGREPAEEVLAGRSDFGVGNSEVLYQRLLGKPLLALAATVQHSPSVLLVKRDSGITSPQNLIGKRVMMVGGTTDVDFLAMLRNEGVAPEHLQIIDSSYNINDLLEGRVDAFNAYLTNEPYYLRQQGVATQVLNPRNYGVDFYSDIIFTSKTLAESEPKMVRAFRDASLKGWRYALANRDELIELILNRYGSQKTRDHLHFEAETLSSLMMAELVELGHMNPGRWQRMAEVFLEQGAISDLSMLEGFVFDQQVSGEEYLKVRNRMLLLAAASLLFLLGAIALVRINIALHREVKERRRVESELQYARANAEHSNQLKSAFMANVSHEIRTPMNAVLGFLQVLGKTQMSASQAGYVETIRHSINDLMILINDILDFSRIESGKIALNVSGFSLYQLLDEVINLFSLLAEEKKLSLCLSRDESVPEFVRGDRVRLRQILSNIIGNAIKFTPQGEVRVNVTRLADNGEIRVDIIDSGIGISPQDQAKVFDPFAQVEVSYKRKTTGTGLGLAISKELVEAMGGSIGLSSEQGKGSCFSVQLPLEITDAVSEGDSPAAYPGEGRNYNEQQILVVDDNAINRHLMTTLLEQRGIVVSQAVDGRQAVEKAEENVFDLIFMDIRMPEVDGIEATQMIRKQGANSKTAIVALTAHALPQEQETFLRSGMDACLVKPVLESELDKLLEIYLTEN